MSSLNFLNPLMLAGLGALAVPLVIHLISLFNAKRIEFSSGWMRQIRPPVREGVNRRKSGTTGGPRVFQFSV